MKKLTWAIAIFVPLLWMWNSSLLTDPPENAKPKILSHRGLHQTFSRTGINKGTCTAARIHTPVHGYLENTIASMRAAFTGGADVVEIDVHLTPDRQFAVFHDWTLDCRTNGSGVTEETPMDVLKTLDAGHGYTPDGGKTFPFRGSGVGMIPTLRQVFQELPEGKFLINFKSKRADEGKALVDLLAGNPAWRRSVYGVFGGRPPTRAVLADVPDMRGYDRRSTATCLLTYLALGWSGFVPPACRNSFVTVPANLTWLLWGWPYRFLERMDDAGSEVVLFGPFKGSKFSSGIDTPEHLRLVPDHFDGFVWTDRVDIIAPLIKRDAIQLPVE